MKNDFTFIKTDRKLLKINFNEIILIKGLGNYVEILMLENKKYIYYNSLKDLIEKLPSEFMRVHNSYIVNLTNIDFFEDNHLTLKGNKISVAKGYRECLNNTLNKLIL